MVISSASQAGRAAKRCIVCLSRLPCKMDDRTALLIPSRSFDSRSYPVIPKVLDCMPSSVGAGLKHVINSVRSYNGRFENPTTGKDPAQAFPEDAREHVDHSSVLTTTRRPPKSFLPNKE